MNGLPRIRIGGTGTVTHICHVCRKPIASDPTFTHVEGRLVAVHPYHKEPDRWPQTPA